MKLDNGQYVCGPECGRRAEEREREFRVQIMLRKSALRTSAFVYLGMGIPFLLGAPILVLVDHPLLRVLGVMGFALGIAATYGGVRLYQRAGD